MENNKFTVENTFIAGSKFLWDKIQNLKGKMGIPITLPNSLIHLWKKAQAVITGKNKSALVKL